MGVDRKIDSHFYFNLISNSNMSIEPKSLWQRILDFFQGAPSGNSAVYDEWTPEAKPDPEYRSCSCLEPEPELLIEVQEPEPKPRKVKPKKKRKKKKAKRK